MWCSRSGLPHLARCPLSREDRHANPRRSATSSVSNWISGRNKRHVDHRLCVCCDLKAPWLQRQTTIIITSCIAPLPSQVAGLFCVLKVRPIILQGAASPHCAAILIFKTVRPSKRERTGNAGDTFWPHLELSYCFYSKSIIPARGATLLKRV